MKVGALGLDVFQDAPVIGCPRPSTGDDGTVAQCIKRQNCGCDEREIALAGAKRLQFLIDFHEDELWELLWQAGYKVLLHDIEKGLDAAIEHHPAWKPNNERTA